MDHGTSIDLVEQCPLSSIGPRWPPGPGTGQTLGPEKRVGLRLHLTKSEKK